MPCEDLKIPSDECREVAITMSYEICNNESERPISFLYPKTIAKSFLYEDILEDYTILGAGLCRTETYSDVVDFCETERIVGSLKVEGHSLTQVNGEYVLATDAARYCFSYSFYSTYVIYDANNQPNPSPVTQPTVANLDYTFGIECFFEAVVGTNNFVVPCNEGLFQNFAFAEWNRNVMIRHTVDNNSNQELDVQELVLAGTVLGSAFEDNIPANTIEIHEEIFMVNFADYAGATYEVNASIHVNGADSGEDALSFYVP